MVTAATGTCDLGLLGCALLWMLGFPVDPTSSTLDGNEGLSLKQNP